MAHRRKEMKPSSTIILAISLLSSVPAFAVDLSGINMERVTTRAVCNSRCVADSYTTFSRLVDRYSVRVTALEAALKQESDPDKKATVSKELAELNEKIDGEKEKTCKVICRNNPEN